jgi:hypothetical protein
MAQSGTRVQVLNNTEMDEGGEYKLCFQWCRYIYGDNTTPDYGYRFIWKTPQGKLLAHRGQARIKSIAKLNQLVDTAIKEGWGNYDGSAVAITEKKRKEAAEGLAI